MKILILDDHKPTLALLSAIIKKGGYEVLTTDQGEEALRLIQSNNIRVVFSDLVMPGMDGLSFLGRVKSLSPELPVILMTGQSSVETAVEAMRRGAEDYLSKPIARNEVLLQIERALEKQKLVKENRRLRGELSDRYSFDKLIGNSPKMKSLYGVIAKVAPTDATVLIRGENGTGKDLVARALHYNSSRSDKPFIKIDCTALPEGLLESELFGYKKGAFTGADNDKLGRVEGADGGTLFLDEISELTTPLQAKVLRLIQEKSFERLGEAKTRQVDIRIVAATNRDLDKEMEQGTFRRDLYYRLNVVPVVLPPLREREGDIILLTKAFLERLSSKYSRNFGGISHEAVDALMRYLWPGNVRELENLLERLVVLADKGEVRIDLHSLPEYIITVQQSFLKKAVEDSFTLDELEREYIKAILSKTRGHKGEAAELLGINRKTLLDKRKRYGMD